MSVRPNIVHGAWADGSSWSAVIELERGHRAPAGRRLQRNCAPVHGVLAPAGLGRGRRRGRLVMFTVQPQPGNVPPRTRCRARPHLRWRVCRSQALVRVQT